MNWNKIKSPVSIKATAEEIIKELAKSGHNILLLSNHHNIIQLSCSFLGTSTDLIREEDEEEIEESVSNLIEEIQKYIIGDPKTVFKYWMVVHFPKPTAEEIVSHYNLPIDELIQILRDKRK